VDHRRTNKSEESLQSNVDRLKEYKSRLVVFPRRSGTKNVKNGDASSAEVKEMKASQLKGLNVRPTVGEAVVVAPITSEMKEFKAFATLRGARNDARLLGIRLKKSKEEKKEVSTAKPIYL